MLQENEVASNNNAPVPAAPEKKDVAPKIEDFDVKENLVFNLTKEELLDIADKASHLMVQKRAKENELKNTTDDLKEAIKGLEADIKFNMKLVEVKKQGRDVD